MGPQPGTPRMGGNVHSKEGGGGRSRGGKQETEGGGPEGLRPRFLTPLPNSGVCPSAWLHSPQEAISQCPEA